MKYPDPDVQATMKYPDPDTMSYPEMINFAFLMGLGEINRVTDLPSTTAQLLYLFLIISDV